MNCKVYGSEIIIKDNDKIDRLKCGGLGKESTLKHLGYEPRTIIEFGSYNGAGGIRYKHFLMT